MVLPIRTAERLAKRYWTFFLPWLIVFAIAPLRPLAGMEFGQFFAGSPLEPVASNQQLPRHVGGTDAFYLEVARFWELANQRDFKGPEYYRQVSEAANKLVKANPDKKWLLCVRIWCSLGGPGGFSGPVENRQEMAELERDARLASAAEPDNAFPDLSIAAIQYARLTEQDRTPGITVSQMLANDDAERNIITSLHKTSLKTRFDSHILDVVQCAIRARQSQGATMVEDEIKAFATYRGYRYEVLRSLARRLSILATGYRESGLHREAGGFLMDSVRLGKLMRSGPNGPDMVGTGKTFLEAPYKMFISTSTNGSGDDLEIVQGPTEAQAKRQLLQYLRDIKMPQASYEMAADLNSLEKYERWKNRDLGLSSYVENRCQLLSVGLNRDIGIALLRQGVCTVFLWLIGASLFWTSSPASSSRAERCAVAAGCALFSLFISLPFWLAQVPPPIASTSSILYISPPSNVDIKFHRLLCLLAVLAPGAIAWVTCALVSWLRQRRAGTNGSRCRRFAAVDVGASGWASSILGAAPAVLAVITLNLLPIAICARVILSSRYPYSMASTPASLIAYFDGLGKIDLAENAIIAAIGLSVFTLCLWMAKWRWATAPLARPAAHAALRWWKESLGAYLVLLSWLYLCVGLADIPARRHAENQVQRVLRLGEVGALYDSKP